MRPLRIGLIGCGYISRLHLQAWELVQGARVVALCDRVEERVQRRAHQFGISNTYGDAAAMLAEEDLDAVDIATRPHTHLPLVELAAAQGAHILCQKPLAASMGEAQEVVEAAERRGVRLMVKENWRWFSWYREVQRLLAAGRLGTVRRLRLNQHRLLQVLPEPEPGAEPTQHYFRDMPRLVIYEFGIHLIDVVRFLLGEAATVYARTGRINQALSGEDVAHIVMTYPSGHALIEINWADPFGAEEALAIDGDRGHLRLKAAARLDVRTHDGEQRLSYGEPRQRYVRESHFRTHQHFTDALRQHQPFETGGSDNLKTLEVTFASYRSAEQNRVQDLGR